MSLKKIEKVVTVKELVCDSCATELETYYEADYSDVHYAEIEMFHIDNGGIVHSTKYDVCHRAKCRRWLADKIAPRDYS